MAVTVEKAIDMKNDNELIAIPVANGETIYKGTFAVVDDDGYLRNLSSTYVNQAKCVVFVSDGSANASGPAATTAAGSISGSLENTSDDAGDKTVRMCYAKGLFKVTFTSIAQADLFKTVYASDNYTVDDTMDAGVKVGTLVTYLSSTSGYVDLNKFYQADGTIIAKGALTAATATTGGAVLSWANPSGTTILVEDLIVDVTTAATGTPTLDIGVAADGTTSSDTIYDALAVGAAAILANATSGNGGTNGVLARKMTSAQYITASASASAAGMVGTYAVKYRVWE